MIATKQLTHLEDFEGLVKGDILVCEWKRDSYKGKKRTRFASYNVVENKKDSTEIILQTQMNVYFNYEMFLDPEGQGISNLKHIIQLIQKK